jgi:hypothetical protein
MEQMMMLAALVKEHAWMLVVFYVLSGVVTMLLHWKTPEEWEAFAEAQPKLAGAVRVLRAMGWNMPKLIRMGAEFLDKKAAEK